MSGSADPFAPRREALIAELRRQGIRSEPVLRALARVPREAFVPPELRGDAYANVALPIGNGQTISQPYIVALMTEAAQLAGEPGNGDAPPLAPPTAPPRVLEIGTGSGYQCAVLAELGADVYTVERVPDLAERAAHTLTRLSITNVRYRVGDGSLGWPEEAPFDAILVTATADHVPRALARQLADGGRLVMPVGPATGQELFRFRRVGDELRRRTLCGCRFVPLVGAEGWDEAAFRSAEDAPDL